MTLYTKNGSYPQPIPYRIRLSNGLTRTDPSTFTEEEIADAGYTSVPYMPVPNSVQKVSWNAQLLQWVLEDKTLEDLQAEKELIWSQIRAERDKRISEVTWRYERYARHDRLGLPQIDNIEDLDKYVQDLADIPQKQTDPYDIVWPILKNDTITTDSVSSNSAVI